WMAALTIDIWDETRRAKIEALQWEIAQKLLGLGLSVIIEWGTWARSERDALRVRARELGASVELHYLSASVDKLFDRLQLAGTEDPPVRRPQWDEWARIFEVPTSAEQALFDKAVLSEA